MTTITLQSKEALNVGYSGSGTSVTTTSGAIGFESDRYRIERYTFTMPSTYNSIPISSLVLTSGKITSNGTFQHSDGYIKQIYGYISTSSSDWSKAISTDASIEILPLPSYSYTPFIPYFSGLSKALTPGQTYYLYVSTRVASYGWYEWAANQIFTLTLEIETKTKCTAPTSIICPSIVPYNNDFNITWTGAKAGNGVNIKGYRIYRANNKIGEILSSATSGTITLNFDGEIQQDSIVNLSIQTICDDEEYNSDIKTFSTKVNIIPTIQCLTTGQGLKLPSTGKGQVYLSFSGNTNNIGQTFSIVQDNQANSSISGLTATISSEGFYTYYGFDGLDKSEPITVKVKVNTQPKVSLEKVSVGAQEDIRFNLKGNLKEDVESGGKYSFYYKESEENSEIKELKTNSTSDTFYVEDFRNFLESIPIEETNYDLGIKYNDGLEDSKVDWLSGAITIKPFPTLTFSTGAEVDSDFGDEETQNTYTRMGKKLTINLPEGTTQFNCVKMEWNNGNNKISTFYNLKAQLDFSSLQAGKYSFNIYLGYTFNSVSNFFDMTEEQNFYKVQEINLNGASLETLQFHNEEPSLVCNFSALLYGGSDFLNFGFSSEENFRDSTKIIIAGQEEQNFGTIESLTGTGDGYKLTQTFEKLDGVLPGGENNLNVNQNYSAYIITTNVFGDVYTKTLNLQVQYEKEVEINDFSVSGQYTEGKPITINVEIKYYNSISDISVKIDDISLTYNLENSLKLNEAPPREGASFKIENAITPALTQDLIDKEVAIIITYSNKQAFKSSNDLSNFYSWKPSIVLNKITKSEENNLLEVDYSEKENLSEDYNWNVEPQKEISYYFETDNEESLLDNNQFTPPIEPWNYLKGRIKRIVNISSWNFEKITYSNYYTIWNDIATISYRKNRLGINTDAFDIVEKNGQTFGPVLQVKAAGNNDRIIFGSGENSLIIALTPDGAASITINCGTWDS